MIALTNTFRRFISAEQSGGLTLLACTLVAIALANSPAGESIAGIWHAKLGPLTVEQWINDALMAVFFLLIGLELEREIYVGELSNLRNAALPVVAALGGMLVPALVHYALNAGQPTQVGFGIPMATDIAFAIGILALLGSRVPASLKVFVVAFAVIDDLGAIVIIAAFYTTKLSLPFLLASLGVWSALVALNRVFRVQALYPYVIGGVAMWTLMLLSGVHATIAGVLLAFAIPFSARSEDEVSPSHRLENMLHKPVAFVILPLFALANTGLVFAGEWTSTLMSSNSLGVILGLLMVKPVGVLLASWVVIMSGLCKLPEGCTWRHLAGAGILGGIGFTMSIFITHLAFPLSHRLVMDSKMAVLMASLVAGMAGFIWLRLACPVVPADQQMTTPP